LFLFLTNWVVELAEDNICKATSQMQEPTVVISVRSKGDEIPFNGFLILQIYNGTFRKNYVIMNGQVEIQESLLDSNASVLWMPLDLKLYDLGNLSSVDLSKPIELNNIKNIIINFKDIFNNSIPTIGYFCLHMENKSWLTTIDGGLVKMTVPIISGIEFSVMLPFIGNNFTVAHGILDTKNDETSLQLNVVSLKNIQISFDKSADGVVLFFSYGRTNLTVGTSNGTGHVRIDESYILPIGANGRWIAIYAGVMVGEGHLNLTKQYLVLNLTRLHLVSIEFLDLNNKDIDIEELNVKLNQTHDLYSSHIWIPGDAFDLTINIYNVTLERKVINVSQDGKIVVVCKLRRIRMYHEKQPDWILGVYKGEPIITRYRNDMLLPLGVFSVYSSGELIGYINSTDKDLKFTSFSPMQLEDKPKISFDALPLFFILLILVLITNIFAIRFLQSISRKHPHGFYSLLTSPLT
jgi:hypothetical protein